MTSLNILHVSVWLLSSYLWLTHQTTFETYVIVGNQYTSKAEVYDVTFTCGTTYCAPLPLEDSDLIWSSPDTPGISEVKFTRYKNQYAVLCTTENGAIVYGYPSGSVLFHKEIDSSNYINVHSAEVLPDNNVVVAGSVTNGIFAVLYPDGFNVNQAMSQTVSISNAPFAHGVVFDRWRKVLYAAGYLTFLSINYNSGSNGRGSLSVLRTVPLSPYYDSWNKNEDANYEDGVHDLYPVGYDYYNLYMTTGEHAFTVNLNGFSVSRFSNVYTIDSRNSRNKPVYVKGKGGIKAISLDPQNGVVLAKSSPWFGEYFVGSSDNNYSPYDPRHLLWSMPSKGYCAQPDYDITTSCKINFDYVAPIWFYKARTFVVPALSYW